MRSGSRVLDAGGDEGAVVRRREVRVAGLRTGHDFEHQRAIRHRSRHGAVGGKALPGVVGGGRAAHEPARRLVADDAATGRRDADGATAVGALGDRPDARRERRRGTAARAAGRAGLVQRVARDAEEQVLRRGAGAHLRRVGLADQDGPGPAQARDAGGVGRGHVVGERARAVGRRVGRGVGQVLGRERDAVQRAAPDVRQAVALACLGQRTLAVPGHDGVDPRVLGLEALERSTAGLLGRDLATHTKDRTLRGCPRLLSRQAE